MNTREFTNEDCMTLMERYPDKHFDLAIVDPPYGIGRGGKPKSTSSHGGHKGYEMKDWDDRKPGKDYFDELFRVSTNQIIWGANYYPEYLPSSPGWILWDKGQRIDQADGELAFSSFNKPLRIFTKNRVSIMIDGAIHPTQKPVALYKWLLTNYAKPGDLILGTHVGSASSLIACEEKGFSYVGCELDPEYFAAASKRIETYRAQLKLFQPT